MSLLLILFFNRFIILDQRKMISVEPEESDNDTAPQISLQEMLDDLHIKEDAMDAE